MTLRWETRRPPSTRPLDDMEPWVTLRRGSFKGSLRYLLRHDPTDRPKTTHRWVLPRTSSTSTIQGTTTRKWIFGIFSFDHRRQAPLNGTRRQTIHNDLGTRRLRCVWCPRTKTSPTRRIRRPRTDHVVWSWSYSLGKRRSHRRRGRWLFQIMTRRRFHF